VTSTLPFYVALAGPTASGKTAAALEIAQRFPVEIVSVDSALVYRGMDIGTAKPGVLELQQAPHHLIDIRDPLEAYSAAEFVRDASALIREISGRGNLPLLVGGTMLYFKALADGIASMPAADAEVREALEKEAAERGWPALHAQLAQIDPVTAQRLAPADSQRIQRALEVYRITGLPLSHFHNAQHSQEKGTFHTYTTEAIDEGHKPLLLSLEPVDRTWLHERIAQRFDAMLAAGFLDEVKTLKSRGDLHPDLPSMRCVGYRQAWQALEGQIALSDLRELGIIATRQLAKRQITWLRSMPHRIAIDCTQQSAQSQVVDHVARIYKEISG